MSLYEVEKLVVERAYAHYDKNKTTTARVLGIAIRTLDSKLEQYEKENENAKSVVTTQGGSMESNAKSCGEKRTLPMQERKEVQEMPSRQATARNQPAKVS